jgi:hypothetical protein
MTAKKICVCGWNKAAGKCPYPINCARAALAKEGCLDCAYRAQIATLEAENRHHAH